jgi:hypothetical protein
MTVVLLDRGDDVVVRDASLWRRARMHLLADRWDRQLAAGASPDDTVEHSLRAQYLATSAQRALTASALRRVLTEACAVPSAAIRLRGPSSGQRSQRVVVACSTEIGRLAARLDSSTPVSPRGLARCRQLVTDGGGPLHYATDVDELRTACVEALRLLQPEIP